MTLATRPTVTLESIPDYSTLAKMTGISTSMLSRIFSPDPSEKRWTSEETATKIARALGISIGDFYDLVLSRRQAEARRREAVQQAK